MTQKRKAARNPPAADARPFTREDLLVLISATALSLSALQNDYVPTVMLCLFVAAFCYVYLAWVQIRFIPFRVATAVAVFLLFAYFGWVSYSRVIHAKQDEVYTHMNIEMGQINPGKPMFLFYTVRNGSSAVIKRHRVSCLFNKIMARGGGGFIVKEPTHGEWVDLPIQGGGDAQTGRCFTDFMSFDGNPVVCADVTILVSYASEIEPDVEKTKRLRFIATEPSGPQWYQESPDTPGNYCDGAANLVK
jgi:hypothetical protein